jgi:hypothetical protein
MTDETASNKLLGIELVAVKKIGTAIALLIGHPISRRRKKTSTLGVNISSSPPSS